MLETNLNGVLGFIFLAAVPIAFVLNLVTQKLYRQAIERSMRRTSTEGTPEFVVPNNFINDPRALQIVLDDTVPRGAIRWSLALRYLLAGIAYAIVEVVLLFALEDIEFSIRRALVLIAIFMTPAIPFCIYVAGLPRVVVWCGSALWIGLLKIVETESLTLIAIQVGPSAIAAMILASRAFRTTSLTVYLIALALIVPMLFALDLALVLVPTFFGASLLVAVGLMFGLGMVFSWVTSRLLARISSGASGLMLQSYAIWFIMTLWQISLLSSSQGGMAFLALLSLLAFVTTLFLLSKVGKVGDGSQLLFLRVFGQRGLHQKSTLGQMTDWRTKGPVMLIGAADLATETLNQDELSAFLGGGTDRLFIKSPTDIDEALGRSAKVAHDGLYPVLDFYCQDDTWRPSVQILMGRATRVVLDLRGFSKDNQGVQYEIAHLIKRVKVEILTILVDGSTDIDLAQSLFQHHWLKTHGNPTEEPVELSFLKVAS